MKMKMKISTLLFFGALILSGCETGAEKKSKRNQVNLKSKLSLGLLLGSLGQVGAQVHLPTVHVPSLHLPSSNILPQSIIGHPGSERLLNLGKIPLWKNLPTRPHLGQDSDLKKDDILPHMNAHHPSIQNVADVESHLVSASTDNGQLMEDTFGSGQLEKSDSRPSGESRSWKESDSSVQSDAGESGSLRESDSSVPSDGGESGSLKESDSRLPFDGGESGSLRKSDSRPSGESGSLKELASSVSLDNSIVPSHAGESGSLKVSDSRLPESRPLENRILPKQSLAPTEVLDVLKHLPDKEWHVVIDKFGPKSAKDQDIHDVEKEITDKYESLCVKRLRKRGFWEDLENFCKPMGEIISKSYDVQWRANQAGARILGPVVQGVAEGTPIVGHVIGIFDYAMGWTDAGNRAMESATRTTAVAAAGMGGFVVAGPGGAFMAGSLSGMAYDGVATGIDSAVHNEYRPHNIFFENRDLSAGERAMGIAGFVLDGVIGVDGGNWYNAKFHAVDAHGNPIPNTEFVQPVHNDGHPNLIAEVSEHPSSNPVQFQSSTWKDEMGRTHGQTWVEDSHGNRLPNSEVNFHEERGVYYENGKKVEFGQVINEQTGKPVENSYYKVHEEHGTYIDNNGHKVEYGQKINDVTGKPVENSYYKVHEEHGTYIDNNGHKVEYGQKINDVTGKPVENSYYKVHEEHGTYVDADGHKVEYGQKINDVTGKPVKNSYYKVHEEHGTYIDNNGHKVEYGQKINDVTGKPVENSYYKVHEEHGTYVDADGHKVEYGQKINDVTGKPVENSYYKVHEEHGTYVDADGHKVEYGQKINDVTGKPVENSYYKVHEEHATYIDNNGHKVEYGQKINDVTGKPVENSYYKVHEEHATYVDADGHKVEYGQKINDVTGKPVENSYYKVHEEHATYVDADGHKVEYGQKIDDLTGKPVENSYWKISETKETYVDADGLTHERGFKTNEVTGEKIAGSEFDNIVHEHASNSGAHASEAHPDIAEHPASSKEPSAPEAPHAGGETTPNDIVQGGTNENAHHASEGAKEPTAHEAPHADAPTEIPNYATEPGYYELKDSDRVLYEEFRRGGPSHPALDPEKAMDVVHRLSDMVERVRASGVDPHHVRGATYTEAFDWDGKSVNLWSLKGREGEFHATQGVDLTSKGKLPAEGINHPYVDEFTSKPGGQQYHPGIEEVYKGHEPEVFRGKARPFEQCAETPSIWKFMEKYGKAPDNRISIQVNADGSFTTIWTCDNCQKVTVGESVHTNLGHSHDTKFPVHGDSYDLKEFLRLSPEENGHHQVQVLQHWDSNGNLESTFIEARDPVTHEMHYTQVVAFHVGHSELHRAQHASGHHESGGDGHEHGEWVTSHDSHVTSIQHLLEQGNFDQKMLISSEDQHRDGGKDFLHNHKLEQHDVHDVGTAHSDNIGEDVHHHDHHEGSQEIHESHDVGTGHSDSIHHDGGDVAHHDDPHLGDETTHAQGNPEIHPQGTSHSDNFDHSSDHKPAVESASHGSSGDGHGFKFSSFRPSGHHSGAGSSLPFSSFRPSGAHHSSGYTPRGQFGWHSEKGVFKSPAHHVHHDQGHSSSHGRSHHGHGHGTSHSDNDHHSVSSHSDNGRHHGSSHGTSHGDSGRHHGSSRGVHGHHSASESHGSSHRHHQGVAGHGSSGGHRSASVAQGSQTHHDTHRHQEGGWMDRIANFLASDAHGRLPHERHHHHYDHHNDHNDHRHHGDGDNHHSGEDNDNHHHQHHDDNHHGFFHHH